MEFTSRIRKVLNMCMCTHTLMGTKTITIMKDVYDRLIALKKKDESFSEELRRLIEDKKDITEFAGMWSDMSDKEAEDLKNTIRKMRKGTRLKELYGI